MENSYVLTSSGSFISVDELYHHGTKGMRWGVRRYQNADGSLTAAGRRRYMNSDGTLNKRGEKYYAKEKARLKAEKETLANEKKSTNKLAKLEQMRTKNNALRDEVEGKKAETESKVESTTATSKPSKQHDVSSLTTKEIQDYNNRMQTEDNFKQLLEKRGYKVSLDQKTEIDHRIDELNKQKTLMQLEKEVASMSRGKSAAEEKIAKLTQERDIAKLEKEIRDNTPKKESAISKFINSQAGQNITNQLIKSGENLLTNYMKTKGVKNADLTPDAVKKTTKEVGKILGDEAADVASAFKKQAEKQAKKEAKAEEKQAKKEAKKTERDFKKAAKTIDDMADSSSEAVKKVNKIFGDDGVKVETVRPEDVTVSGVGSSRSNIKNNKQTGPVYDADFKEVSNNGKSYVSNNNSASISTLVRNNPPRENHEYIKRIESDYGYRYIYELPSSIDR